MNNAFVIICADKTLRNDIAKKIAGKLNNMLSADIQDVVDFELLNHPEIGLNEAGEFLKTTERKAILKSLQYKNTILTLPCKMFVANDNFELFADRIKVYIRLPKRYLISKLNNENRAEIEQELLLFDQMDDYITRLTHYAIDSELKSVDDIAEDILKSFMN